MTHQKQKNAVHGLDWLYIFNWLCYIVKLVPGLEELSSTGLEDVCFELVDNLERWSPVPWSLDQVLNKNKPEWAWPGASVGEFLWCSKSHQLLKPHRNHRGMRETNILLVFISSPAEYIAAGWIQWIKLHSEGTSLIKSELTFHF